MTSDRSQLAKLLTDDPEHGIPFVTSLDVHSIWPQGGSDLRVIIAKPLDSDDRSRERLMAKLENYLNFVNSPEYVAQCGTPEPKTTRLVVSLHPEINPIIEATLNYCTAWIESNNAGLKVQYLDSELCSPQPN